MKKLLSITLAIMVLISVWSTGMFGITASAATVTSGTNLVEVATSATNYDKLRNYIFTYKKNMNKSNIFTEGRKITGTRLSPNTRYFVYQPCLTDAHFIISV